MSKFQSAPPTAVTAAAPTVSSSTQETNSPTAAKMPGGAAGARAEVAGVVGGVGVPAGRVAEGRGQRDPEAAGDTARRVRRGAPWTGSATAPITKTTASSGKANRSNSWIRLCPKYAIDQHRRDDDHQAQVLVQAGQRGQRQPTADAVHREPADAGGQRVRARRAGSCRGTRNLAGSAPSGTGRWSGPNWTARRATSAPSAVPSTIARNACQNVSPKNSTQMTPTKTVANSRFGDVHVQSSWIGRPCRSASGMASAPPGSTAATFAP